MLPKAATRLSVQARKSNGTNNIVPQRKLDEARLAAVIKTAHLQGRGVYCAKRIQSELTAQGFKDIFIFEIVGRAVSKQMTKQLVVDALRSALRRGRSRPGMTALDVPTDVLVSSQWSLSASAPKVDINMPISFLMQ
jgi:hypothetical protein